MHLLILFLSNPSDDIVAMPTTDYLKIDGCASKGTISVSRIRAKCPSGGESQRHEGEWEVFTHFRILSTYPLLPPLYRLWYMTACGFLLHFQVSLSLSLYIYIYIYIYSLLFPAWLPSSRCGLLRAPSCYRNSLPCVSSKKKDWKSLDFRLSENSINDINGDFWIEENGGRDSRRQWQRGRENMNASPPVNCLHRRAVKLEALIRKLPM